MQTTCSLYDTLYESAIRHGWSGWGGNDRLAQGPAQIARILAHSEVPSTGKALELGCGEGNFCRLLAQQGYEVTGVDVSSVAIRWANEKNAKHHSQIYYIHGDLSQSDVHLPGPFDLIVDGNCLHCIRDEGRQTLLKTVYDNLSETGVFFVSSLCSQDSQTHIMLRDGEPYRYIPPIDGLRDEVRQAGFEILDSQLRKHPDRKYDHLNLFAGKTRNRTAIQIPKSVKVHEYTYDSYGF